MRDTIISRWPTKNSAHDALYAEVHRLRLPHNSTALPAAPLVIERKRRRLAADAVIVACDVAAVATLTARLWLGVTVADSTVTAPTPASYLVTIDR